MPTPDLAHAAQLAANAAALHAKRKVGQARSQLDKAAVSLAQATDTVEQYGAHICTERADADRVAALVRGALTEHEEVDVVLLIPSTARARRERRRSNGRNEAVQR